MNQNLSWLEKFVDKISQLLKEPPYHLFTFIGAVLVIITLIIRYNFNYTWAFFLYAVFGTMLRHAEKDLLSVAGEVGKCSKLIKITYNVVNIIVAVYLIVYMKQL